MYEREVTLFNKVVSAYGRKYHLSDRWREYCQDIGLLPASLSFPFSSSSSSVFPISILSSTFSCLVCLSCLVHVCIVVWSCSCVLCCRQPSGCCPVCMQPSGCSGDDTVCVVFAVWGCYAVATGSVWVLSDSGCLQHGQPAFTGYA